MIGHSMGAMVACKLAAAAPQRLASLSVLSATGGGWQAVPKSWSALWLGIKVRRGTLGCVPARGGAGGWREQLPWLALPLHHLCLWPHPPALPPSAADLCTRPRVARALRRSLPLFRWGSRGFVIGNRVMARIDPESCHHAPTTCCRCRSSTPAASLLAERDPLSGETREEQLVREYVAAARNAAELPQAPHGMRGQLAAVMGHRVRGREVRAIQVSRERAAGRPMGAVLPALAAKCTIAARLLAPSAQHSCRHACLPACPPRRAAPSLSWSSTAATTRSRCRGLGAAWRAAWGRPAWSCREVTL